MQYQVKTRNFNCNRLSGLLLSTLRAFGVQGCLEADNDGKFYLSTSNPMHAWAVWMVFMAVRPISGGWTYICRPGASVDGRYLSVY